MLRAVAIVLVLVAVALAAWFASEAAHAPIVEPPAKAAPDAASAETRDESGGDVARPTRVETDTAPPGYISTIQTVTVFGRVLDAATKAPIADARVEFGGTRIQRRPSCVSASDGAYRLENVRLAGEACLIVRIEGRMPFEDHLEFEGLGERQHDILVDFGQALRGRVIDATTRAPIEGARIEFQPAEVDVVTTTSGDGSFVVYGVRTSDLGMKKSILTRKPGYIGSAANLGEKFDIGRELVLPMIPECTIEGTVLDADGKPVPNAIVRRKLRRRDDDWREQLGVVVDPCVSMKATETRLYPDTNAAGWFRIDGLGPWCEYAVWVTIGNHRLSDVVRFDRPNETKVIVLRPKQGSATITGTITVDGSAVPDCGIEWTTADNTTHVHVNADGTYVAEHVVPGIIDIEATHSFGGPDQPRLRRRVTVEVHDGETLRQDFAWRFDKTRIDGVALDDADLTVPTLTLEAIRADPYARVIAVTDENGRFAFDLPDALGGNWGVEAVDAGWQRGRASFIAGSSGVTLHLGRAQ